MEKKHCGGGDKRKWEDMSFDILVKIFMSLNVVEFTIVSMVCTSWKEVCQHPLFWETRPFDLNNMNVHDRDEDSPFNIDYYGQKASKRLTQLLKRALYLTIGNLLRCLVFNAFLPICDHHLIRAAKRSPGLKRLVLPASYMYISEKGIGKAMELWKGLESLTLTMNKKDEALNIMEAIGKYCNNLSELKVTRCFTVRFVMTLVKHVPKLKVLSLESAVVNHHAFLVAVTNLRELEVLNISHTQIIGRHRSTHNRYARDIPSIMELSRRVPKLVMCEGRGKCNVCPDVELEKVQKVSWDKYKNCQLWRHDTISSLRF